MAQESNTDDAVAPDDGERGVARGCSGCKRSQNFYAANDPKMFATLLTMSNIQLTRLCGRHVADEYSSDVATQCFVKISSLLDEDKTGMKVADAYLRTHVFNRIRNLYKKLTRERLEAKSRLPVDPDQLADPITDAPDEFELKQALRREQIQVMVRRCLNEHIEKQRDKTILMEYYSDLPQAQLARRWKLSAQRIHQIIAKSKEKVRPCLEDGRTRLEVA